MNVLQSWKALHNQIAELRELLADARTTNVQLTDKLSKEAAENDELRELIDERRKELDYLMGQKARTIELKDCDIAARDKIIAEAFSLLDSTHARLKVWAKVGGHDHDDAA